MNYETAYQLGALIHENIHPANALFNGMGPSIRWVFIQGLLETFGIIHIEKQEVVLVVDSPELMRSIATFVGIPYLLEKEDRMLVYENTNAVNFLDKIYHHYKSYHTNSSFYYEDYKKLLSGSGEMGTCLVFRTCPEAILPTKSRVSDTGYDISIIHKVTDLTSMVSLYDTGIKIRVPYGYYTEIVPQSSLSKSGYMLANSVGIIDQSYHGNLYIALAKIDSSAPDLVFPFRCCQIVFRKHYHLILKETTKDLDATTRGENGFGSTG